MAKSLIRFARVIRKHTPGGVPHNQASHAGGKGGGKKINTGISGAAAQRKARDSIAAIGRAQASLTQAKTPKDVLMASNSVANAIEAADARLAAALQGGVPQADVERTRAALEKRIAKFDASARDAMRRVSKD